ncbi:MAG: outer membrane beta-barrel protein [Pseudomonadota bacterium]
MTELRTPLRALPLAAVALALALSLPLERVAAAEGWYVGVGLPVVSLDGDFDGEAVITSSDPVPSANDSTEIVPEFDPTAGFALLGGLERGPVACEFGFVRADLDGDWQGFEATGEFTTATVDVKYLFRHRKRVRPVLIAGLGVRRLDVIDGSTTATEVADADFRGGVDWRLGVGADLNVSGNLNVDFQAIYRFSAFSEIEAIMSGDLVEDFDADGVTLLAAIKYTFGN